MVSETTHHMILSKAVLKQKAVVLLHLNGEIHSTFVIEEVIIACEEGYKCRSCGRRETIAPLRKSLIGLKRSVVKGSQSSVEAHLPG